MARRRVMDEDVTDTPEAPIEDTLVEESVVDVPPVRGQHFLVEEGESFSQHGMPADWGGTYLYRATVNGHNVEHVAETADGVWIYRRM